MARRSDHSREEIRELALNAAETIVAEQGFTGLSARKIAGAIGYTVGTIYLVFKNLDDLIMQVNARTLDKLYEDVSSEGQTTQHKETLRRFGQAYFNFASQNPHLWSLIFEHHVAGGGELIPELGERIGTLFQLVETEIKALNPKKKKQSIHRASLALWSGVHGITILAISDKLFMAENVTPPEMIDQLIDNFLTGYLAP
ncbi:MAG: TetR family transcriptional regulator [Rhodomicrobium sp.]|nr:MAG: TetR family transcriptional regulator [Rhodomicrobium sp.]